MRLRSAGRREWAEEMEADAKEPDVVAVGGGAAAGAWEEVRSRGPPRRPSDPGTCPEPEPEAEADSRDAAEPEPEAEADGGGRAAAAATATAAATAAPASSSSSAPCSRMGEHALPRGAALLRPPTRLGTTSRGGRRGPVSWPAPAAVASVAIAVTGDAAAATGERVCVLPLPPPIDAGSGAPSTVEASIRGMPILATGEAAAAAGAAERGGNPGMKEALTKLSKALPRLGIGVSPSASARSRSVTSPPSSRASFLASGRPSPLLVLNSRCASLEVPGSSDTASSSITLAPSCLDAWLAELCAPARSRSANELWLGLRAISTPLPPAPALPPAVATEPVGERFRPRSAPRNARAEAPTSTRERCATEEGGHMVEGVASLPPPPLTPTSTPVLVPATTTPAAPTKPGSDGRRLGRTGIPTTPFAPAPVVAAAAAAAPTRGDASLTTLATTMGGAANVPAAASTRLCPSGSRAVSALPSGRLELELEPELPPPLPGVVVAGVEGVEEEPCGAAAGGGGATAAPRNAFARATSAPLPPPRLPPSSRPRSCSPPVLMAPP
mmetsp:Transcript_2696/g.8073  ORF Transcript_2696/g.8073 Transcript_2696/m.8073 type:complete len:556 (-) Transcript_2696:44-1711(-)